MKKLLFVLFGFALLFTSCFKPEASLTERHDEIQGDTVIMPGDTLTYEVITADPGGWYGVWNRSDGVLVSVGLDSISWGNPLYLPGGWRYTFIAPSRPFQALISAFTKSYSTDIIVNLYKNGKLLKSSTAEGIRGFGKVMATVNVPEPVGTAADPVLKYEVLVTEPSPNITIFQRDAWLGQWNTASGVVNDLNDRLAGSHFPMPSGWKYIFKPDHRPFRMYLGGTPYSPDGGKVTINFYVNQVLVKSVSAREWMYGNDFIVP